MTGIEVAVGAIAIGLGLMARRAQFGKNAPRQIRGTAPQEPLVGIVVRRPIMPTAGLREAYFALPPHCLVVLGR